MHLISDIPWIPDNTMLPVALHVYIAVIVCLIVHYLGHGKKIHCFSGKTFPTLEAVGRFFFIFN